MNKPLQLRKIFLVGVGVLLTLGLSAQKSEFLEDSVVSVLVSQRADSILNGEWFREATGYQKMDSTTINRVEISLKSKRIRTYADSKLAYTPFREDIADSIENGLRTSLGSAYDKFSFELYSGKKNIREYIPNSFRTNPKSIDKSRSPGKLKRKTSPLVQNLSRPFRSESSLYNLNIALWHSHGWYYEAKLNRWEWQRARLFQTVEDIYPMSYTLPFLVPMLENSGANVFIPRERDWQVHEVIVDKDGSTGNSLYLDAGTVSESADSTGFAMGTPPYTDENPFKLGRYTEVEAQKEASSFIQWVPDIPEAGMYAVYISFHADPENADDAHYSVYHAGGVTEFSVNQQMGGGTWIYLGRFKFDEGIHPGESKVVLSNQSNRRKAKITADAVRFGGGMGNIQRNGLTGKRPRYQEAARYYLQYAGVPDTLVWKLNESNDYNDDFQSRGEWVNYLVGAPSGPKADRDSKGLGIPVDLSLGFHTDAGISGSDTVIGTLGIYSTNYDRGYFPSGLSRMASRDLTDQIQTQIVEDLRAQYDPEWTRRGMWDRGYSEAYRPNVPAMLLELFSHQNFIDIRFGQEPMFRFHVSRAIYKGMLKFLSTMYGIEYVVQPLAVDHLHSEFLPDGSIRLAWKAQSDPLEPTAEAESYVVYTRTGQGGFDNGIQVDSSEFIFPDPGKDTIYSFKVTAVNRGGESFPSEVLSICAARESRGTVAIVNAFDRTSGPAWFDDEKHAGFMDMVDQGVPYVVDLHTVGAQFDFVKSSPWLDDDSPGHGASYADLETHVIPGNTFDFSQVHGVSLRNAGYSFVSVSDEAVTGRLTDLRDYILVDFMAGEERSTYLPKNDSVLHYQVFHDSMLFLLQDYLEHGGSLFISGAHIASDMHQLGQDSVLADILKYKWRSSNASRLGKFYFVEEEIAGVDSYFSFNTGISPDIYTVEGADALEPADSSAITLLRYAENNMSAGVAYRGDYGVVVLGFPFETIGDPKDRDFIMRRTLKYLLEAKKNE
ncbi:MAG: xanthan lyase [Bacteroidota bacterium]